MLCHTALQLNIRGPAVPLSHQATFLSPVKVKAYRMCPAGRPRNSTEGGGAWEKGTQVSDPDLQLACWAS